MAAPVLATVQEREAGRRRAARALLLREADLRVAAGVGIAWLLFYAGATWATGDLPAARQAVGELLYLLPIGVAVILSVLVVWVGREPRWFWRLLAVSNLLWLAGDLIWASYSYLLDQPAPFPSVADASYLGSYVLVPAAVIVGFHAVGCRLP